MRRAALLAAAAAAALLATDSGPAAAQVHAAMFPGSADPHMRRADYDPAARTALPMCVDCSTVLTFAPGEQVKRVVIGAPGVLRVPPEQEIQQTPLENVLPLWGAKAGATTLQVVTVLPGGRGDRVYQFAVTVAAGADGAVFGLAFAYPAEERVRQATAAEERRREAAERAAEARERRQREVAVARLQQDVTCRNGLYKVRGERALFPDDACDDGVSTAFLFRGARPVPAVFLVEPDGKTERAVNADQRGDWLIVPAVRARLVLRLGQAVAEVANEGFDPAAGGGPGTGTGSPDVFREVIPAAARAEAGARARR